MKKRFNALVLVGLCFASMLASALPIIETTSTENSAVNISTTITSAAPIKDKKEEAAKVALDDAKGISLNFNNVDLKMIIETVSKYTKQNMIH